MTDEEQTERPWRWRNLRSCSVLIPVSPCPWDWHIRIQREADCYGWKLAIQFGPIGVVAIADIGNVSAEGWRGCFGVSETTAWERSAPKRKDER